MEEDEEEDLLQDDDEEEGQQGQGQAGIDEYASPALPSAGGEFGTGAQQQEQELPPCCILFELFCAASGCSARTAC